MVQLLPGSFPPAWFEVKTKSITKIYVDTSNPLSCCCPSAAFNWGRAPRGQEDAHAVVAKHEIGRGHLIEVGWPYHWIPFLPFFCFPKTQVSKAVSRPGRGSCCCPTWSWNLNPLVSCSPINGFYIKCPIVFQVSPKREVRTFLRNLTCLAGEAILRLNCRAIEGWVRLM